MNKKYVLGRPSGFLDLIDFPIYRKLGFINITCGHHSRIGSFNSVKSEAQDMVNKLNSGRYRFSYLFDNKLIKKGD